MSNLCTWVGWIVLARILVIDMDMEKKEKKEREEEQQ